MDLDSVLGPAGPRRAPRAPAAPRPTTGITVESLAVYERNGDGHTLGRHCAIPPEVQAERLERHPGLTATGSFPDAALAQRAVEACVAANSHRIAAWDRQARPRLAVDHRTAGVIGDVLSRARWRRGQPPQPAGSVRVVLQSNPRYASGFAVLTAYPQLP